MALNQTANSSTKIENPVPDWVMALIGISIVAWFMYTFNVMEILSIFFTLVVVPILFIVSLAMGGMGLYSVISKNWNAGVEAIQTRVASKVAKAA